MFLGAIILVVVGLAAAFFLPERGLRIVIAVVAFAIALPLLVVATVYDLNSLIFSRVNEITSVAGISSKIAYAITAIFLAIALSIRKLLISSDSKERALAKYAIAIAVAAYWLGLYLASERQMFAADGSPIKCYTISSEGVDYYDSERANPKTGEKCIWLTPAKARALSVQDKKLRNHEQATLVGKGRIDGIDFFVQGTTGYLPIVWISGDADGVCAYYDTPGVDPQNGKERDPATPSLVAQCSLRFQAAEKKRLIEIKNEDKAREDRLAAEKKKLREQALVKARALVNKGDGRFYPLGITFSAEATHDEVEQLAIQLFYEHIGKLSNGAVIAPLHADEFISSGSADDVIAGNISSLVDDQSFLVAKSIAIGKISATCSTLTQNGEAFQNCKVNLNLTRVNQSGIMTRSTFQDQGVGISNIAALEQVADRLLTRNKTIIQIE